MIRIFTLVLGLVFAGAIAPSAEAAVAKHALGAVAVSPDGKTLLAAGDNRVLFVLDPVSLKVKKRMWIGVNPQAMHFSADGSTFILHDSRDNLHFYDAANLTKKTQVAGVRRLAIAEKADLVITAGRPKGRGEQATTPLRAYHMATGRPVLDRLVNMSILSLGADTDAARIFALSASFKSTSEPKQNTPTGLRGVERSTFRQQNDGRQAHLVAFDLKGNELGRFTTWYSVYTPPIIVSTAQKLRIFAFNNHNAEFTLGSMNVKLFETKNRTNFGSAYSLANNRAVTGGQGMGTVFHLDTDQQTPFRVPRIGGLGEFIKGFTIGNDGTVFGGTTAYRIVRIGADGRVTAEPVY